MRGYPGRNDDRFVSPGSPHLHGHIHSYGDPDRVYFRWVNYSQRIFTCNFADIHPLWL